MCAVCVFSSQDSPRPFVRIVFFILLLFSCVHSTAAKHADVQEEVYEEVAKVMDAEDGRPDFNAVNNLTRLCQVIKEVQRLHPILPFVGRSATKDTVLGGNECTMCVCVCVCVCV